MLFDIIVSRRVAASEQIKLDTEYSVYSLFGYLVSDLHKDLITCTFF